MAAAKGVVLSGAGVWVSDGHDVHGGEPSGGLHSGEPLLDIWLGHGAGAAGHAPHGGHHGGNFLLVEDRLDGACDLGQRYERLAA